MSFDKFAIGKKTIKSKEQHHLSVACSSKYQKSCDGASAKLLPGKSNLKKTKDIQPNTKKGQRVKFNEIVKTYAKGPSGGAKIDQEKLKTDVEQQVNFRFIFVFFAMPPVLHQTF